MKQQKTSLQKYSWQLQHLVFWLFIYLYIFDYQFDYYPVFECIGRTFFETACYAVIVYFNYFVLIPAFLKPQKKVAYGVSVVGLIIASVFIFKLTGLTEQFYGGTTLRYDYSAMLNCSIFVFLFTFFWYYEQWHENQKQQMALEKEKLGMELNFLKTQISPHFFFNTLNNIYSLSYQKDDNAPKMVAKLSNIMRHTLYTSATEKVPLQQEVDFLKNYVDLQLLKKPKSKNIDFYIEGVNSQQQIAPLILINFFENAFKHSTIYEAENAWINISLMVNEKQELNLVISNSQNEKINSELINSEINLPKQNGIGLANTKRQLNLLYPDKHNLEIKKEGEQFTVNLILEL